MQIETTSPLCPLCKQPVACDDSYSNSTRLCEQCRLMVQRVLPSKYPAAAHAAPRTAATFEIQARADLFLLGEELEPVDSQDENDSDIFAPTVRPALLQQAKENYEKPVAATQPLSPPLAESLPEDAALRQPQTARRADSFADYDPALDYTLNEWPLLVLAEKKQPRRKLWIPLAAALLLACGAAGYFFLYQPYLKGKQATSDQRLIASANINKAEAASLPSQTEPAKQAQSADDSAHQQSNEAAQATGASNEAALPAASSPAASSLDATATNGDSDNQGQFSLQAASFPSQAAAAEFSEKLASAGVQSYIIAADITGRGRWFRVRVGRFGSQQEAERFAEAARQRARAAAVNLQLIVCDYEKH